MERFEVETDPGVGVVDVTERVRAATPDDADRVTVFVEHTTAAVVVNEAERRLLGDIESFVDSLAASGSWAHDALDGNAAAHLRATVLGPSETVPVADGRPALGTWQSILLVECDGPRTRTVAVG
jgi:secondary thiamine-phosphate synthase enzyme